MHFSALPLADGLSSIFDLVTGLPVHPLVAHFAVVLLPLAGLGLILCVFMPSMRKRFGLLALIGVGGGAAAAFVAAQSGEQLAKRVGLPQDHAALGQYLPYVGFLLFFIGAAWYFAAHQAETVADAGGAPLNLVFGGLTTLLALAVVIGTTLVGHSGAVAVWEKRINPAPAPTSSATPTASQNSDLLTLDDVAAHSTKSDCWSVIGDKVYDLTPWLANNPADASVTCGAVSASAGVPVSELPNYEVGNFDTSSSAPGYTAAEVAQHSTAGDCWSIVNGRVYDLTNWVNQHPGGQAVIEGMCGKDGSAGFNGQHAGAGEPAQVLAEYELGPLK